MKHRSYGPPPWWRPSGVLLAVLASGCSGGGNKPVHVAMAGGSTVTLEAPGGHLVEGKNTVTVVFVAPAGQPESVLSSSIRCFMPAMGGMAMMAPKADLAATGKPGSYRATIDLPTAGTWQTTIAFNLPSGPQLATFNVQVP